MPDPLSITSGCVSLLGYIGKLSTQIYTFVSETRHAREDMDMVTRELSSLRMCLECLKDESIKLTPGYPPSLRENVVKIMKNCGEIAEKMSKLLRDYSRENRGNKMQWATIGRSEMNILRSSLETHKTALDVALDMISISLISTVKEDTKVLVERSADVSRIKHDTALIPQLLEELTMLRTQVSQLSERATPESRIGQRNNIVLQRFLDESTAYAESAYGGTLQESRDLTIDPKYALGEGSDTATIYVDCNDSITTPVRAEWNNSETTLANSDSMFDFGDSFKINNLDLSLTSAFDKERDEGDKSVRLHDSTSAIRHYHRALEGYEKNLGPEHKQTLATVDSLGIIYLKQSNITEANTMFQRALEVREKLLGPEHDRTIWTVFHVGLVYYQQDKYPEAEKMLRRALEAQDRTLGPQHKHTISTAFNLGLVYNQQKNYTEALKVFRRALEAQDKTLGPQHEQTINTVYNLGLTFLSRRDFAEAKKLFQRALEMREKAFGPQDPRTVSVIFGLGDTCYRQENFKEAEKMFRTALTACEKTLGPEADDTLRAVGRLRSVYERQGRILKAIEMGQRVQKTYEKTLGRDAKRTRAAAAAVGHLFENMI